MIPSKPLCALCLYCDGDFYMLNVKRLKCAEKIVLINLLSKYKFEYEFSEKISYLSSQYDVKSYYVTSLFSRLHSHGFISRERCYAEKNDAQYKYKFQDDLKFGLGRNGLFGATEKISDYCLFIQEMKNRYPNINKIASPEQRLFLLILIAHQDEFGTVTHLASDILCDLMGDISRYKLRVIQKKLMEAGQLSILKTSATFFNEVKNVYVLKGVKAKGLKVKQTVIELPDMPCSVELFNNIYPRYLREGIENNKKSIDIPKQLRRDRRTYATVRPTYIDTLLRQRIVVSEGGLNLLYGKYFSLSSSDSTHLMQIKLNRMASFILSSYWNELDISNEDGVTTLTSKLSEDRRFLSFVRWGALLSKGMLKTIDEISSDILNSQLMYGVRLTRRINPSMELNYGQRAVLDLYTRTVQALVSYSIGMAHQYFNLLREHGSINSNKYEHIVEAHFFQNLPRIIGETVPLYSVHSYIPNTQGNELYHLIEYRKNAGEKKKVMYKRMLIESTLIR